MHALIIVDMQQASIANSDKYDCEGVVSRINKLSNTVRSHPGLVIFIAHDGEEQEGLLPHSDGWKILDSLTMKESDIIIRKKANDAFYQTPLADTLVKHNVSKLLICGWATDFCVDATLKSALNKNYQVTAVADCHTVSDRGNISALQVINYHNWLWSNMIATQHKIAVLKSNDITFG